MMSRCTGGRGLGAMCMLVEVAVGRWACACARVFLVWFGAVGLSALPSSFSCLFVCLLVF